MLRNMFTVCSSCKQKFVVSAFVNKQTISVCKLTKRAKQTKRTCCIHIQDGKSDILNICYLKKTCILGSCSLFGLLEPRWCNLTILLNHNGRTVSHSILTHYVYHANYVLTLFKAVEINYLIWFDLIWKLLQGSDHSCSLEPEELRLLGRLL